MKITVTAREVLDSRLVGAWDKFCDMTGLNYYALNDGIDSKAEFEITLEQARQLGLIDTKEVYKMHLFDFQTNTIDYSHSKHLLAHWLVTS